MAGIQSLAIFIMMMSNVLSQPSLFDMASEIPVEDELGVSLFDMTSEIPVEDELGVSLFDMTSEIPAEDELGVSLFDMASEIPAEDELGVSLQSNLEVSRGDMLGESLIVDSPADEVPLGTPIKNVQEHYSDLSSDVLGVSLYSTRDECEIEETSWLEQLKDQIRGPFLTSTPAKPQYDRVKAKEKKLKHINSYLCKEVQGANKLKQKAMDDGHIKWTLKQKCKCSEHCFTKMSFKKIRQLRLMYWSQSTSVRQYLLKSYIKKSLVKGRHRFIDIDGLSVCSQAFLSTLRINKNSLTNAFKAICSDNSYTQSRCPRKVTENTLIAINWMEDYASFYGDRMPNSEDVKLPYKFRKLAVYEVYHSESENPVSKSQFFRIWKTYFPHLKIKQTNSFSKCATCTILEKHRENAVDYGTKAMYGQLKDEHHERQHMERRYYYSKRESSRKCPKKSMSLIIDGMDQAKTNLPHFSGRLSKDINPADLLKTRVTGVINHGVGGFHTYVDINEYPHDPNLTINVLLKALKKASESNGNRLPPILYLQADNCGRENKNRYVLAFLEMLVRLEIFQEVHLSFLYVGHTHEDIDAAFSKISKTLKTCDVETVPDLLAILPKSEELGTIYNVKEWMEPYIAKISKLSFPLHYKFEQSGKSVKMFYKGQESFDWIEADDEIMNKLPKGVPLKVKPDYSKTNVEKNLKQINKLQHIFKNRDSLTFWTYFYNSLEKNSRKFNDVGWILDQLPRQPSLDNTANTIEMPEYIKRITSKEKAIPEVTIKRKKKQSLNTGKETTKQRKEKSQKSKPNHGRRRHTYRKTGFITIPLTDEVKRHIWLFLFICVLETVIYMLTVFVMLLLLLLYNVLYILKYLSLLFHAVLSDHFGSLNNHVNSYMLPMNSILIPTC